MQEDAVFLRALGHPSDLSGSDRESVWPAPGGKEAENDSSCPSPTAHDGSSPRGVQVLPSLVWPLRGLEHWVSIVLMISRVALCF